MMVKVLGLLGGSGGWASDFGSGRDLAVREFEPHIRLWADSSEPGACFRFCLPLSLTLPCSCSVSVSKINKNIKKNFLKNSFWARFGLQAVVCLPPI